MHGDRALIARALADLARNLAPLAGCPAADLLLDAAGEIDEREARLWRTRGMRAVRHGLELCRRVTAGPPGGAA